MTRFFIVRHGNTKGTERLKFFGRTDMPLSRAGIRETKRLKKQLERSRFDYIYSSPLKRCLKTANILKGIMDIPLEVSNDLIEIDFGSWEGLTLNDMKKRNPLKFNQWLRDFATFNMPEGEKVRDMIKRVVKFWNFIAERHKDNKNILVVTHGGPLKVIVMHVLGLPMKDFWNLSIETCSISMIDSVDGNAMVRGINLWAELF